MYNSKLFIVESKWSKSEIYYREKIHNSTNYGMKCKYGSTKNVSSFKSECQSNLSEPFF